MSTMVECSAHAAGEGTCRSDPGGRGRQRANAGRHTLSRAALLTTYNHILTPCCAPGRHHDCSLTSDAVPGVSSQGAVPDRQRADVNGVVFLGFVDGDCHRSRTLDSLSSGIQEEAQCRGGRKAKERAQDYLYRCWSSSPQPTFGKTECHFWPRACPPPPLVTVQCGNAGILCAGQATIRASSGELVYILARLVVSVSAVRVERQIND